MEATVRFETQGGLGEKLLSRCAQSQIELEAVVPTATVFKGRVRAVIMQRWRNMPGAATAA